MPEAPNVDGLPVWLQVAVSLVFGIVTLAVGLKGYLNRPDPTPPGTQPAFAQIIDASAIRNLTETCQHLSAEVQSLERSIVDHCHYVRQSIEVNREVCQRLRELRERMDRGG